MHVVLGRLRGRVAPAEVVLDQIHALCSTWRLHWAPWAEKDAEGKPTLTYQWIIGNRIASPVYRETGRYCLQRLEQAARVNGKDPDPAMIAGAELMLDGDYLVGRFPGAELSVEQIVRDMGEAAERLVLMDAAERQRRQAQRLKLEWQMAAVERQKNPAFHEWMDLQRALDPAWFADLDALTKEAWSYHMTNKRHFAQGAVQ